MLTLVLTTTPGTVRVTITSPARNIALWPFAGLVVLPTAVSSRTRQAGSQRPICLQPHTSVF